LTGAARAGDSQWVDADARIETFPLRIPFRAGAGEARPPVDSLLVKVTTAQGREGWGDALDVLPAARGHRTTMVLRFISQ
jgi:L-alanine-DL-glutamate epimerase-like enolase superfamily enzyme